MSHPTHHLWFRGLFIFTWNNRNSCHTLTNKQSKHLTVHNLQNFHYMHLCLKNKNLYLIYIKGKYHFNGIFFNDMWELFVSLYLDSIYPWIICAKLLAQWFWRSSNLEKQQVIRKAHLNLNLLSDEWKKKMLTSEYHSRKKLNYENFIICY